MAAIGAISLGVYEADPAPTRSFPITFSVRTLSSVPSSIPQLMSFVVQDGEIVYPEVAYPLRKNSSSPPPVSSSMQS